MASICESLTNFSPSTFPPIPRLGDATDDDDDTEASPRKGIIETFEATRSGGQGGGIVCERVRVAEIFNNLQYRLIGLSKGVSLVTLINPSSAESAAATCRTIRFTLFSFFRLRTSLFLFFFSHFFPLTTYSTMSRMMIDKFCSTTF